MLLDFEFMQIIDADYIAKTRKRNFSPARRRKKSEKGILKLKLNCLNWVILTFAVTSVAVAESGANENPCSIIQCKISTLISEILLSIRLSVIALRHSVSTILLTMYFPTILLMVLAWLSGILPQKVVLTRLMCLSTCEIVIVGMVSLKNE